MTPKILFLLSALCSLLSISAQAATHTVPGSFATIQACANAAQPGDTCLVSAGTYDERVTLPRSGSAGSPITFQAQGVAKLQGFTLTGKSYITISGFEITHSGLTPDPYPGTTDSSSFYLKSSSHIQIIGNYIHHTNGNCILMYSDIDPPTPSNYVIIRNNTLVHCGSSSPGGGLVGIQVYGNHNLVEGNDISHNGEDFSRLIGGDFNVIRNNNFHDNYVSDRTDGVDPHIDGIQNWCVAGGLPLRRALIEGNCMTNGTDINTHFAIFQDYGPCGESDVIIRQNTAQNIGSGFVGSDRVFKNLRVYNNTAVEMGVAMQPKPWTTVNFTNGSTGGKIINNLFYNTVRESANVYTYDSSSAAGFYANNNQGYNSVCGTTCTWSNPSEGISTEPNAVLNKNPLFINVGLGNLQLQAGSPGIDKGGPLTKVSSSDSGSGLNLIVDDAGMFQAGQGGIVEADWIAVGSAGSGSKIASINYVTNTITLVTPLIRANGNPVFLFKDSSGRQVLEGSAPDIGAYEFVSAGTSGCDVNGDGTTTVSDVQLSANQAIGISACTTGDINRDATCNVIDVQRVVNAALGGTCVTP